MNISGRFWIEINGEPLVGRGRIELLERIRDGGSISEAAKAMNMSYKSAWNAIEAMNRVAQKEIVLRAKGGARGGGSQLTAFGLQLIQAFHQMEADHQRFLGELGAAHSGLFPA